MDFFEQQHRARRRTWLMLLLFVLAVVAIVTAFDLVCAIVYVWLFDVPIPNSNGLLQQVPRSVYLWSTLATLLVIGWGTASRLVQLSGGGVAVADLIGARHVKRDTGEPAERRLLNVVEEMALASGITVPLVFVMDDQHTINAFAAGYSPNEATVIVTRGALDQLNRDELQGVVAHEFSHILNGDMRLNIHLVGVIAGIVMIGSIGAFLMTGMRDGDDLRRAGTDIRVFFLGLLLWLIGSIGVLAGRLIKAVISREREFLADASAVQFTRNPDGIGGAFTYVHRRPRQRLFRVCLVSRSSAARRSHRAAARPRRQAAAARTHGARRGRGLGGAGKPGRERARESALCAEKRGARRRRAPGRGGNRPRYGRQHRQSVLRPPRSCARDARRHSRGDPHRSG